jgi:hypothetical protein
MSPAWRRAQARQRLERIAIEQGASRSQARAIAARYFGRQRGTAK